MVLLACVATALVWRIGRWLLGFPLFGDEAFLARTFQHAELGELRGTLRHEMVAPYGFLVLTWVTTRLFGLSELVLRFWPMVAGVAGMLLWVRIFTRRLEPRSALLAAALLAASYYPTRHAAELKPYAVDFLASALIIGRALAWNDQPGSRPRTLELGLVCALGALLSYPAAFVLGGAALALLPRALATHSVARLAAATGAGVLTFALLYAATATHQRWSLETIEAGQWAAHFPPERVLEWPAWIARELTGRMFAYPNGGASPGSLATTLLCLAGALTLARHGRGVLVGLCLAPLAPMLVAAVLHAYPFGGSARVNQHLAGPICLLAGVGLARVLALAPRVTARRATLAVAGLLALVPLVNLAEDLRRPWKHPSDQRCRAFVRGLASTAREGEVWAVVGGEEGPAREQLDWIPLGGSAARLAFYLDLYAPRPVEWGLDPTRPRQRRVVLVYQDNAAEAAPELLRRLEREAEAAWGAGETAFTSFGPGRAQGGPDEGVTTRRYEP